MKIHTAFLLALLPAAYCLLPSSAFAQKKALLPGPVSNEAKDGTRLHNGWMISPAGSWETLDDLPLGTALSPDGKILALTNGGAAPHHLYLADARNGKVFQILDLPRAQSRGLAFSPDGKGLYVAGGNSGYILRFAIENGKAESDAPFTLPDVATITALLPARGPVKEPAKSPEKEPEKPNIAPNRGPAYLSGLTIAPDSGTLYVANLATNAVYALSLSDGAVRTRRALTEGDRPGVLRVSPDGKTLYAALWAKAKVLELDAATLETRREISVGDHPNDIALTRDGSRIFVSCGNSDAVYAMDAASGNVAEKIAMALTPAAPAGATPCAVTLSPDDKTLYVANADNNSVAVVDVSKPGRSRVAGFIPTGWYPTTVTTSADGSKLFVGCGKGVGTGPNNKSNGPIDPVAPKGYPYIAQLLRGLLETVPAPDAKTLAAYTKQVYRNSPYASDALKVRPAKAPRPGTNPIPSKVGDSSPIKYVLYIIKENRTYDQLFGDLKDANGKPLGNGDPNLTLFGEDVTPNHHALAREFVVFDNLYCDGEVSVDGHHWSNGAYVPDFMQQTWPAQYGGKGAPPGRGADFGDPLYATPAGRIWDLCAKANVPFRTYYYHTNKNRSDEWAAARARGERDYLAADVFIKELAQFERKGEMPRFQVMALSEDHTSGTRPGAFTPKAAVASNDLGVGKIVEACSKSKFWKEMAIFIIEDDAQNGPDHVDAHRTVALAISPYTRRGGRVDSTFYTTVSLLRTMELILGLPPMSQYDAASTPLYAAFANKPDIAPYVVRPAKIDLTAKNAPLAYGAKQSLALDFSEPDRLTVADEDILNRVLWHSIKGAKTPYPAPVRRPFFRPAGIPLHPAARPDED